MFCKNNTLMNFFSLIGGENEESQAVFTNLEKLLGAINGYIHPSNYGKWAEKLLQFIDTLTQKAMVCTKYFLQRMPFLNISW